MIDRLFAQEVLLFTVPVLVGVTVFVIKLGLMAIGGIGDGIGDGVDADIDFDGDLDVDAADHSDSTDSFNLLSIQSIAALLMGFGAGGLAAKLGLDWPMSWSVAAGLVFGFALVWLLGLLMKAIYDLQSSGNISIHDAVGREGVVYSSIPAQGNGSGRVRVVIDNRMRMYSAVTDGGLLNSQARVRIVRANGDNTLTVSAVTE